MSQESFWQTNTKNEWRTFYSYLYLLSTHYLFISNYILALSNIQNIHVHWFNCPQMQSHSFSQPCSIITCWTLSSARRPLWPAPLMRLWRAATSKLAVMETASLLMASRWCSRRILSPLMELSTWLTRCSCQTQVSCILYTVSGSNFYSDLKINHKWIIEKC